MTEYLIFKQNHDGGWEAWGNALNARSAKAALQSTKTIDEGTYVAVPARSWRPVTVKVETKTALRFS